MATQALPSYLSASTFTTVVGGVTQTQVETVVVSSVLPTQQLPPYLSASTFTDTIGGVATTGTTLVEIPLTYIGPSIPLGTDGVWTFLGSTTPASLTSTQTSSSAAIPSSTSQSLTSSPTSSVTSTSASTTGLTSSSSSSGSSTESKPSSTISSTSPASSTAAVGGSIGGKGISTSQLIGIIIAAVVAALVIVLLCVLFFYRRRRHRNGYEHPNMSDFVIIDSEGQARFAGEGSPRPTGEEEDSFLRGSGATANEMREVGPTARLVNNPSPTATERTTGTTMPPEGVIPTALKTPPASPSPSPPLGPKLPSPFFHASASSLFFNPTRGPDQSLVGAAVGAAKRDSASTRASSASTSPTSPANGNAGNIIPPRQLLQMDGQWHQESNNGTFGAVGLHRPSELGERTHLGTPLRPPAALGFDTSSSRDLSSMRTMGSHPESPSDDERATLLMAHRFNMSESGPTVLVQSDNETSSPASWRSSLGLGLTGLARLSRLSWFQRMDANRAHSPGSAMPTTRSASQLRSVDTRSSLVVPRPVSNLTTSTTGDTTYYDAPSGPSTMSTRSGNGRSQSRSPHRPVSMPPIPPRAVITPEHGVTSSAPQTPRPDFDSRSDCTSSISRPVLLLLDPGSVPGSPRFSLTPPPPPLPTQPETNEDEGRVEIIDILDTPVPARAAVSPFSTTSTRGGPAVPPGLEHLANIRSWRDSSSDMPSSATFGSHSSHGLNVDTVGSGGHVLEEAPPLPTENWMQLRAVTVASTIESNRTRRALGQSEIEDPHDDVRSAAGFLHSIPDRLSPLSPMGSGSNSRAPSRQYNSSSLGSSSSQFSRGASPLRGHSAQQSSGNGTSGSSRSQLDHSNSITSDGRRRPRREPGEPRALSPANSSHFHRARLSAIGGHRTPITTPQRSPGLEATFGQNEGTGALVGRTT